MNAEGRVVLRPLPGPEPVGLYQPRQEEPQQQVNIVALVHRHLRGRYLLTMILAAIGAAGGLAAGYFLPTPKYRAEGLIRIQPVMPRILYQSEENTLQPMFASFVNTQANLLQNERVRGKAMRSVAWRSLGRGFDAEAEANFGKQLVVRTSGDTPELIFVSFSDKEAKAAFVAVQEVITAYKELFGGIEAKNVREMTVSKLTTERTTLEAAIRDLQGKSRAASADFDSDDLNTLGNANYSRLEETENRLAELKVKLAAAGIDPAKPPEDISADDSKAERPPVSPNKTPEEIAEVNRPMAQHLMDREGLRRELQELRSKFTEDHRQVRNKVKELDTLDQTIKELADSWIDVESPTANASRPVDLLTPRELLGRFKLFTQQVEDYHARAQAITKAKQQVDMFSRDEKKAQEKLDDVTHRLDQISMEATVQDRIGRIEDILPEAPPSTPNDDPRKKFAMMGLFLGAGIPIGLMLMLSLVDRRFRYADQAGEKGDAVPMLGILPDLPSDNGESEQVAAAVHSIHHIRTRLQLGDSSRKVYAITSPTSGDGKTSLSLSLAISFTASGAHTLLIDFDLVGHALTSRLGASCDRGIGFHLIGPDGQSPFAPTAVPGLSLIPAGSQDVRCHSRVTREAFAAMINDLRVKFDVIIIDTGPILGSLEANIASSVADGVILVVGRGQHGGRLKDAINHLGHLGARVAGMVFNRARAADFNSSTLASGSFRSVRAAESLRDHTPATPPPPGIEGLDALARSMALDRQEGELSS